MLNNKKPVSASFRSVVKTRLIFVSPWPQFGQIQSKISLALWMPGRDTMVLALAFRAQLHLPVVPDPVRHPWPSGKLHDQETPNIDGGNRRMKEDT